MSFTSNTFLLERTRFHSSRHWVMKLHDDNHSPDNWKKQGNEAHQDWRRKNDIRTHVSLSEIIFESESTQRTTSRRTRDSQEFRQHDRRVEIRNWSVIHRLGERARFATSVCFLNMWIKSTTRDATTERHDTWSIASCRVWMSSVNDNR